MLAMTHPDFAHIGDPATNLIEECAELIQALTKLQRFGPGVPPYDNRAKVIAEIADVRNRITEWDIANADSLAARPPVDAVPGEPVAKVLFRQDEDGLEPVMFYGPGTEPDPATLKDRFVIRDVWLSTPTSTAPQAVGVHDFASQLSVEEGLAALVADQQSRTPVATRAVGEPMAPNAATLEDAAIVCERPGNHHKGVAAGVRAIAAAIANMAYETNVGESPSGFALVPLEAFNAVVRAAPVAPRAGEEPMAWADGEGRVLSAAQMENARNHQGEPGKIVAAQYSTPLYPPRAGEESKTYRDFLAFDDHESTPPVPAKGEEASHGIPRDLAQRLTTALGFLPPGLHIDAAAAPTATVEPREPLTADEVIDELSRPCYESEDPFDWFEAGVRFAERHHGIATLKAASGAAVDEFWNGTLSDRNNPE